MKGFKVRKAQSVLEYVILLTVVVAAIIAVTWALGFDRGSNSANRNAGLGKMLYAVSGQMANESSKIANMAK